MEKVEQVRSYLLEKKKRILDREKQLKQKEKIALGKKFSDWGKLVFRAGLSDWDPDILLGALLEIKERAGDDSSIQSWKKRAAEANQMQDMTKHCICVKFEENPPQEIKTMLKNRKFKWNSFRGEYYGYGDREVLADSLKDYQVKIEVIEKI
jgi:hypothetical protein